MSSLFSQTVFRSSRTIAFAPRAFSTSLVAQRTAAQAAKDTLKTVDRKVSDKLVDGIEVGRMYLPGFSFFSLLLCSYRVGITLMRSQCLVAWDSYRDPISFDT
jgi:hypothetical protein